jgi:hypothetical protein
VRGGNIAIKIGVEGGELEVLKGAVETISSAPHCVITVEANPRVAKRTNRDPIECPRVLETVRQFEFVVAETNKSPLMSCPLIQEGQKAIWNVIAWTH